MCKLSFKNNIYFVAKRSEKNRDKLDYYLVIPGRGHEYAFTRDFKSGCYQAYKKPVLLNKVLHERKPNTALMNLKKYVNYIMPYLVEYLNLEKLVSNWKSKSRYAYVA